MKTSIYRSLMLMIIVSLTTVFALLSCSPNKEDNALAPVVGNVTVSNITRTTATLNVIVSSDGGSQITKEGVSITASTQVGIEVTPGVNGFTANLSNLVAGTTYTVKAYATNNIGASYSSDVTFSTLAPPPPAPKYYWDGFGYDTIRIGTQVWFVQDLKVRHFRNGDLIPNITDNAKWLAANGPARCYYNNDSLTTVSTMYNAYAAKDLRGIAPPKSHVANYNDWKKLLLFIAGAGGNLTAAKHMKPGAFWLNNVNMQADNATGFTAVPNFTRSSLDASYLSITGGLTASWLILEDSDGGVVFLEDASNIVSTGRVYDNGKVMGLAVRCVMDDQ